MNAIREHRSLLHAGQRSSNLHLHLKPHWRTPFISVDAAILRRRRGELAVRAAIAQIAKECGITYEEAEALYWRIQDRHI